MTPNIAEMVEKREWTITSSTDYYVEHTVDGPLIEFAGSQKVVNAEYVTQLESLVDKYQKLVESSKEYLQHSYECLDGAHLHTPCQCGLEKLREEMKESGLFDSERVGEEK